LSPVVRCRSPAVAYVGPNGIQMRPQMQTAVLDKYLTQSQLAAGLKICSTTLKRWRALGEDPPSTKIGNRVYYSRDSVIEWMRRREQRATA
jgi:Helix-turn-helix domain